MAIEKTRADPTNLFHRVRRSLSAKLLWLTILFVLLVEALLLIPSVAKQRVSWLSQHIEAAYLVGLALEAPEAEMIKPEVVSQLFATANILGVNVNREGASILIFSPSVEIDSARAMHFIDLRTSNPATMIGDAWATVFSRGDDLVRVIGEPTYAHGTAVDVIVSQRALRRDLMAYARNILGLSFVISGATAMLVYWSLNLMIVRPVGLLTNNMASFHANPDDPGNIIAPSNRVDEIGVAQRSLYALEQRIHELLSQRRRLAALGAGISKISHDLRNILASAQLMSDRLAKSDDPRVRKLSPRLIQALDRAIALSRDTLSYGRMEPASLTKQTFRLRDLIGEVFDDTASTRVASVNDVPELLEVTADRNQLYRAFFNLARNAVEAMAGPEDAAVGNGGRIIIRTRQQDRSTFIEVNDNGPGIPDEARAHLFEPFKGSAKPGGSGLGIAIAYEILRAHGGDLRLKESGEAGTTFEVILPTD